MGDIREFQPLTFKDGVSVVLYRAGIAMSAVALSLAAFFFYRGEQVSAIRANGILIFLYASVGLGVFFIHLYESRFHRALKRLYYVSLVCLAVFFLLGGGSPLDALTAMPYALLLLVPLSGCLGFIAAKEAFCFGLVEGYVLSVLMPAYIVGVSLPFFNPDGARFGLYLIALLLVIFTLRKVFMPLHYDIGDKSAYR